MTSVSAPFLVEVSDDVAELIINRPEKRNAITEQMWVDLPGVISTVDADPSIKVLLIRGSTPEAFSSGADIGEYRARIGNPDWGERSRQIVAEGLDAIRSMSKPSIAAIEGACVGGGVGIALACDLRVASSTGFFAIPPARLGLVYPFADTRELVGLIGPSQAKRLLFTAHQFEASEARDIGFIDLMVDEGQAREAALRLATEIAHRSQYSVRAMKRTINLILEGQVAESEETRRLSGDALSGEDHAEGVKAFLEKRPARFTYR